MTSLGAVTRYDWGPDRRGTVGTELDTRQGGRTWRWGPGRGAAGRPANSRGQEAAWGGLRRNAPWPVVAWTRDPVSFSLPTRVIGLGARSSDALPCGLPPAGSQCRQELPGVSASPWALFAPGTKAKGSVLSAGPPPP